MNRNVQKSKSPKSRIQNPHGGIEALRVGLLLWTFGLLDVSALAQPAAPPSNLQAKDHPWDNGSNIDVQWTLSPDDPEADDQRAEDSTFAGYKVYRSMTAAEIKKQDNEELEKAQAAARDKATAIVLGEEWKDEWAEAETDWIDIRPDRLEEIKLARKAAAQQAEQDFEGSDGWMFVGLALPGEKSFTVDKLEMAESYSFRVRAFGSDGSESGPAETAAAISPRLQWFEGARLWLSIITIVLCGAVVYWIIRARQGKPIRVRKIAGLEAVDEAVGRATEMGRSCLFIPGIQDMNDIQTIAGITILSRVAKTAAEYDAKIEVPTARSLVMTAARETVQSAFLSAGRPDAYNPDLIYYVTDEQFGYVAYLQGMMVREKPAACFYMGHFFAESLILAETGNSIGAIQVAGTAAPAQLPFFVAACDYTLIGEEFFAATAYLSGEPDQLGSLKGQDVGKLIVWFFMVIGIALFTIAAITSSEAIMELVQYIKGTMLT